MKHGINTREIVHKNQMNVMAWLLLDTASYSRNRIQGMKLIHHH